MTIRGSFAFGAILASLVIALGFSPGRSEPAQPAENPSGGAPRYLDGIDRGAPPPALAPRPASPLAAAQAPHTP
ncbi:MAG TPA: hypothetical protein VJ924_06080, partial [Alphaproteobacteria bacterium]|nr:hypothetical protein [Alphaproteobacteria bacterium]